MRDTEWVRVDVGRSGTVVLAVAVTVGILVSTLHWVGLAVGGALVGLLAPTTRRALVYGAGFGAFAWVVFAVRQFPGAVGTYVGAPTLLALSAAMALGLAVLGASVREFT